MKPSSRLQTAWQGSAGHSIVAELEAQGVSRVYCVPGESYLDVIDGLGESKIQTVVCRQEGGVGFMAMSEGRLTGVPGVAMVTRGPGAANAMVAVHTAYQDATPMVLFVGLIPVADRGREAFQEFSLEGWFGTTAKAVLMVEVGTEAARVTSEAFRIARSGRPGPVIVGLPEDILLHQGSSPCERTFEPPVTANGENLAHLESLVSRSKRPMVVVGGEGWDEESRTWLTRWACDRRIPISSDFRAQDIIDNHADCWAGQLGYGRSPELAEILADSDLVLYLGAVRSDVLSDGYELAADATTIVVNPDPRLLGHVGRLDLHLGVHPRTLARVEAPPVGETHPDRVAWFARARKAGKAYAAASSDGGGGIDRAEVMAVARRLMPEDAVVTYGAGNYALWPQRFLPARTYPSVVAPKNGAMGMGIPAAVAASLVFPERTVVSFAGDGCFLMNGQELATAAAVKASPTVIILDNGTYGTIRQHQEIKYPGRPHGTTLRNPDFAALAESYGANGHAPADLADFESAFKSSLTSGQVDVIHLKVDPTVAEPHFTPQSARTE